MTTRARSASRVSSRCWIPVIAALLAGIVVMSASSAPAAADNMDKKPAATKASEATKVPDGDAKASRAAGGMPSMMGPGSEAHPSFSVDMVMTHDGQTYTMSRTIDHGKTRMDMKADGQEFTQIALDDEAGTTYTVMPAEKRVMKQSRKGMEKMMPKAAKKAEETHAEPEPPQGKLELVGKETIDGHPADKYKVSYGEGDAFMWIDSEKNLPLRMEAQGSTVEFKNYKFGPQPAERFEPPKGYEIMDMDEMMAKMPKGGGMGTGMMGALMGGAPGMGMAGGMSKNYAGSMAGGLGGSLGGALGGALGGPIGSMVGQYLGSKLGQKIGSSAAGAVLPGK
jgi:outer membrane lipoprotein-sorting protein